MGDDKSTIVMASRERDRDRELLIPVADSGDESSKPSSSSSSSHHAGRENAGLGFITSVTFIFLIGVFMSSWLGASVLSLGEWFIKRMPFVRHIYNASKQISAAISPDQNTQAFKEVAIIRHPRIGEYAFGFITSSVVLQNYSGEEELCCVYVPTNHLYIGDIFLINTKDVIRPNLSVREGIEIVVSGGMSMPQILSTLETRMPLDGSRPDRR
ncbi:protein CONTINUOUS VASCULAR RING 1 [Citrus sinensis]|nr:protein CONTINUOUS VASCULAR RING 1 [Citrus sinensis]